MYPSAENCHNCHNCHAFNALLLSPEDYLKSCYLKLYVKFFYKQHALKGQKLLAQGSTLGNHGHKPLAL